MRRPFLKALSLAAGAVVVLMVLVGEFVSASLALAMILSLAWSLWFSESRIGFWAFVAILFGLNLFLWMMAWWAVWHDSKNRVINIETVVMACGLTLSFVLASAWLIMINP